MMLARALELSPADVDLSRGAELLNRTKRFVLPVPLLPDGGEPLVVPAGFPDAGRAIYAEPDGSPQRGVRFYNGVDRVWQGAQGNGKEAVIINNLSSAQAAELLAEVRRVCDDPAKLTAEQLSGIVEFARNKLAAVDLYDKGLAGIAAQMCFVDRTAAAPSLERPESFLGYMQVSKDTVHRAVLIDRAFTFDGPVKQHYPRGAMLVTDGAHTWGVGLEAVPGNWQRTAADGGALISDPALELPRWVSRA